MSGNSVFDECSLRRGFIRSLWCSGGPWLSSCIGGLVGVSVQGATSSLEITVSGLNGTRPVP